MNDNLVIGQAPGATAGPVLSGRMGEKLARLHGLSPDEFRSTRDLVNLIPEHPGKAGKGDAFPAGRARALADAFDLSRWSRVIFLGRSVARAFRFDAPFLEWRPFRGSTCAVVPHTSGINRWYNDAGNAERARLFLHALERRRVMRSPPRPPCS